MVSGAYFSPSKLAILVESYRLLSDELTAATDQERCEVVHIQIHTLWKEIWSRLTPQAIRQEPITTLVPLYQVLQSAMATNVDQIPQELLRSRLLVTCDALWIALAEPLTQLAYGWLRSALAQNLFANPASYAGKAEVAQALALSTFSDILQQLPKLRIDPHNNPLGYLLQIARRSLYVQNGGYLSKGSTGRGKDTKGSNLGPPDPQGTEMWPDRERPIELPSDDFKMPTEKRIDAQQNAAALQRYIARTFSPTDRTILERRQWDPPVEFADIAVELGPYWTEANVRVRHYRTMEKIRVYIETCIVAAMCDQFCAAEVWMLVQRMLDPIDETILQIRWRTQPPVEFADIAAELGANWTEAKVRERHHNAMASIFAHVRSLGLVDLE